MASNAAVPPGVVAQEVINQGGDQKQALVAAALVSGIESNGTPQDKNPSSTACGLFQFLDSTWASNGGTTFAPTACGATWQEQVSIFLNATKGDNFYAWQPDVTSPVINYNGSGKQGVQAGSLVANMVSTLYANGSLDPTKVGNAPSNWGGAGGVVEASPTPIGPFSGIQGSVQLPNPFKSVDNAFGVIATVLTSTYNSFHTGFGIGWKAVLTIAMGAAFIIIGTLFLLHNQEREAAETVAGAL